MIQETRDIKFRAYDPPLSIYHHWHIGKNGRDNSFWEIVRVNNLIPEQYTGLKDKNNKDIYEGDITITANGKTSVVQFGNWEIARDYDHGMETQYGIGFNWDGEEPFGECKNGGGSQYEVIGNIYETPELLK